MTSAAHHFVRRLMAVLTVLAAFAFQVRADGNMPGWWAALVMPAHAPMSGMPQMPMSGPTAMDHHAGQHEQPGRGSPAPEKLHDHSAHCPFCVTNAFALDDAPVELVSAGNVVGWPQDTAPLTIIPRLNQHADARAPPPPPLNAA